MAIHSMERIGETHGPEYEELARKVAMVAVTQLDSLGEGFALLEDVMQCAVHQLVHEEPSLIRKLKVRKSSKTMHFIATLTLGHYGLYVHPRQPIFGRNHRTVWSSSQTAEAFFARKKAVTTGEYKTALATTRKALK